VIQGIRLHLSFLHVLVLTVLAVLLATAGWFLRRLRARMRPGRGVAA
jgi:hypothetical protein